MLSNILPNIFNFLESLQSLDQFRIFPDFVCKVCAPCLAISLASGAIHETLVQKWSAPAGTVLCQGECLEGKFVYDMCAYIWCIEYNVI